LVLIIGKEENRKEKSKLPSTVDSNI